MKFNINGRQMNQYVRGLRCDYIKIAQFPKKTRT